MVLNQVKRMKGLVQVLVLAQVLERKVLVRKQVLALERKVRKATKASKVLVLEQVLELVRRPPLAQEMLHKLAKVQEVPQLTPTL